MLRSVNCAREETERKATTAINELQDSVRNDLHGIRIFVNALQDRVQCLEIANVIIELQNSARSEIHDIRILVKALHDRVQSFETAMGRFSSGHLDESAYQLPSRDCCVRDQPIVTDAHENEEKMA